VGYPAGKRVANRNVPESRRRTAHALGLLLPLLAFAACIVLAAERLAGWRELAILGAMYVGCGLGITIGFHRLLTHRSFATHRWTEYGFSVLGSMCFQGSVIDWVADHRKHHAYADADGDPHSPHGEGPLLAGLWHAHAGWLFENHGRAAKLRYAPELLEDPGMRAIDSAFPLLAVLGLLIPATLGWVLIGGAEGALKGLLWGGLARIFLFQQVIFSVNSIGHRFGRRRFETADRSGNLASLAPLSLGESWHHNHHTFPRSARIGLRWFELDPSAWVIAALERCGLAWNVVRVAPERQRRRLVAQEAA
jgi:stearoyl-CoA desaturase (Delta-9 desaturase)